MTDRLRTLLHDLADDQPPVTVAADTFRRGRRAHRRAVAARTAAVAAVVVALGVGVPSLLDTGTSPGPAESKPSPAFPDRIYPVPEKVVRHAENGTTWHPDVAVDGLAVGTLAAILPAKEYAVLAVSATTGDYLGLTLPGFDGRAFFRYDSRAVALSPDGNRLAWMWNPNVIGGVLDGDTDPTGIRVADLETGDVTDHAFASPPGLFAHGLTWSPDGRYLAFALDKATAVSEDATTVNSAGLGLLDTASGALVRTANRRTYDEGNPGVSNEGEVVLGFGRRQTWRPGRDPEVRTLPTGPQQWPSSAWSAQGVLATGSVREGVLGMGVPPTLRNVDLGLEGVSDVGSGRVDVVGWAGDEVVALYADPYDREDLLLALVSARGEVRTVASLPVVAPGQVSVAVDLLTRDTRAAVEPDWPSDPTRLLWWGALGAVLVMAALVAWVAWRARLRR